MKQSCADLSRVDKLSKPVSGNCRNLPEVVCVQVHHEEFCKNALKEVYENMQTLPRYTHRPVREIVKIFLLKDSNLEQDIAEFRKQVHTHFNPHYDLEGDPVHRVVELRSYEVHGRVLGHQRGRRLGPSLDPWPSYLGCACACLAMCRACDVQLFVCVAVLSVYCTQ